MGVATELPKSMWGVGGGGSVEQISISTISGPNDFVIAGQSRIDMNSNRRDFNDRSYKAAEVDVWREEGRVVQAHDQLHHFQV